MTNSVAAQPFFLSGSAGDLFLLYQPPQTQRVPRHKLLFVSAFAEEMNKSRRMAALLSRRLASHDVGMLHLDLYGSGESHGDFKDARWEIWRDDIQVALDWLVREPGDGISVCGLRLGGLLLLDALPRRSPNLTHKCS